MSRSLEPKKYEDMYQVHEISLFEVHTGLKKLETRVLHLYKITYTASDGTFYHFTFVQHHVFLQFT